MIVAPVGLSFDHPDQFLYPSLFVKQGTLHPSKTFIDLFSSKKKSPAPRHKRLLRLPIGRDRFGRARIATVRINNRNGIARPLRQRLVDLQVGGVAGLEWIGVTTWDMR